jgi:hypothetical protein
MSLKNRLTRLETLANCISKSAERACPECAGLFVVRLPPGEPEPQEVLCPTCGREPAIVVEEIVVSTRAEVERLNEQARARGPRRQPDDEKTVGRTP